jgi:hypothetical protein
MNDGDSWEMGFAELPDNFIVIAKCEKWVGAFNIIHHSVKVEIHSSLHVEKIVNMPNSFSRDFVEEYPETFRRDVLNYIIKTYGLRMPFKYELS